MLWTILAILLLVWLVGFAANIVGGLIHIVLGIAVIVFVAQLLTGRRSA